MKIFYCMLILLVVSCSKNSDMKPEGIATPNVVKTYFGTLYLSDGVPKKESVEKVYRNLDIQRATEVFLSGLPLASMSAIKRGILEVGSANDTVVIYEDFLNSDSLFLTPNSTSVYFMSWLKLKTNQAMVLETPTNFLGVINDHFFRYVADLGNLGSDNGQGGKFLVLPPDYKGKIPSTGYYVVQSATYENWLIGRGFAVDGDSKLAVESIKQNWRIYPYDESPSEMKFVNGSKVKLNTLHYMDARIYDEMNEVIQNEPIDTLNPMLLGAMQSLGIEKGKEFDPDERMKDILKSAAEIGAVTARTLVSYPRNQEAFIYTNSTSWLNPLGSINYTFIKNNILDLDTQAIFFFYATVVTPAMSVKFVGKGSQYAYTYTDNNGNILDGGKTYKIVLPPNVPAKDNWSITVYDSQTRSMLQTSQPFATVSSYNNLVMNDDGSYDVYIGPKAPKGFENNWIETIPGKSWNTILRLYGPLEPWFDKSWQIHDPILIQ
ncbi:MAG: DUF1254 domain-containing protein [Brevinemataceae bacterium]